jgi:hypothetical protein
MEAAGFSEIILFYKYIWFHIPETVSFIFIFIFITDFNKRTREDKILHQSIRKELNAETAKEKQIK